MGKITKKSCIDRPINNGFQKSKDLLSISVQYENENQNKTVPNSNRQIVDTEVKSILLTHIYT
jgi:hypothetical protein